MSSERESERSEGKAPRVPMGGNRLKMQLSDADMKGFKARGMVTHWFNATSGRIERALGGGYNFVDPKHAQSLGQGALHQDGNDPESNKRVSIVANPHSPDSNKRAYLMEIPKEFYREDQAKKELVNAQVDDALAMGGKNSGSEFEQAYKPN